LCNEFPNRFRGLGWEAHRGGETGKVTGRKKKTTAPIISTLTVRSGTSAVSWKHNYQADHQCNHQKKGGKKGASRTKKKLHFARCGRTSYISYVLDLQKTLFISDARTSWSKQGGGGSTLKRKRGAEKSNAIPK